MITLNPVAVVVAGEDEEVITIEDKEVVAVVEEEIEVKEVGRIRT